MRWCFEVMCGGIDAIFSFSSIRFATERLLRSAAVTCFPRFRRSSASSSENAWPGERRQLMSSMAPMTTPSLSVSGTHRIDVAVNGVLPSTSGSYFSWGLSALWIMAVFLAITCPTTPAQGSKNESPRKLSCNSYIFRFPAVTKITQSCAWSTVRAMRLTRKSSEGDCRSSSNVCSVAISCTTTFRCCSADFADALNWRSSKRDIALSISTAARGQNSVSSAACLSANTSASPSLFIT
mmetsp:Transcript_17697/g.42687  ORF Transcript_17697/g.42687 Transcript_17697/m.42687 type:complete len:238 (-) Transcript_17697:2253-2966(-)